MVTVWAFAHVFKSLTSLGFKTNSQGLKGETNYMLPIRLCSFQLFSSMCKKNAYASFFLQHLIGFFGFYRTIDARLHFIQQVSHNLGHYDRFVQNQLLYYLSQIPTIQL